MKRIKNAEFIISNTDFRKSPKTDLAEYAFIGRSNVGKSSLINMLTDRKNLAKTSSRPGKTQLINHFLMDKKWYLVDLPGYGYAKVSKKTNENWGKMISDYLINRENLVCVFVLIDSRLPPQKADVEFLDFVGKKGLPLALIFTKADKQSINKTQKNIAVFKKHMLGSWEEFPPFFISSAEKKSGKEEILGFIDQMNSAWEEQN
ncbi:ribosome biogenesis GTP-binding protein YihA/YsxC [Marivirga arenosa]|jgi:GTP-binding protein|uniref:Probable GTP-binding protein EngB n=1 Tax=Marivirga arenosa TaxID=3059076 RepID=A0AA49GD72_9BACT|nr:MULTISPECIES: ribosome biogenesis GTP-binding protein YihA/YsxC [unclassified Marivirga]WKK79099.1 ribosome biogenesis GTP-binding protein YihA/YsxC [Marivirga sp. BKB1-2]WMN05962.1 ribosome biogenesis GTP-binding protein YihA/YsxC [Marivirga sp. ABR2-2]